jgi:adenylate kinase family enzyme
MVVNAPTTPPARIRIVGTSGSGKSRLAEDVAARMHIARLELDAVFWDAGWTYATSRRRRVACERSSPRTPRVGRGRQLELAAGRSDGARHPGGADVVVWVDHPRRVVMWRVLRRTLRRGILREELWHGNRERVRSWLKWKPEDNILRWAWTSYPGMRRRMEARIAAGDPVLRLRGQREVDDWVRSLAAV